MSEEDRGFRDSRWGLVLLSWDSAIGLVVGVLCFFGVGDDPSARLTIGLAAAGAGVAIVAVLATVVTLVAVLFDSEALVALIERMGGIKDALHPYWFHGYLAAAAVATGLLTAAFAHSAPGISQPLLGISVGAIAWSAFGMIDITRHTLEQADWRRRLDSAAKRFRDRHSA